MEDMVRFQQGKSPFDAIRKISDDGIEYWSARELAEQFRYSRWEDVEQLIRRAKVACRSNGYKVAENFRDCPKVFTHPSGRQQVTSDVQMTRYGCYLFAMSGNSTKPEIAAAKNYFAVATRAAELVVPIPTTVVDSPRPWSIRFRETMLPHVRHMNIHHPGYFTVLTTLMVPLLYLEDELIRHLLQPRSSDRPDISIGLCWANHRRQQGLPDSNQLAPLNLPEQKVEVYLHIYENIERGPCEAWFANTYLPMKLPNYLANKPEFNAFGQLPPASAADHVCRELAGVDAQLRPRIRRQLTAAGGFVPASKALPPPLGRQRKLFGESE